MGQTRELVIKQDEELFYKTCAYLYIDGENQGKLPNGKTGSIDIDFSSHKVMVVYNDGYKNYPSNVVIVPANDLTYVYHFIADTGFFKTNISLVEDEKWSEKNKKILMERQVFNTIKTKIDSVFNEIVGKAHPITKERDYSLLKNLPDYCLKSDYFKKIVNNMGMQICESVSNNYFGIGMSIDNFYKAMKDLADLYMLDYSRFPSLNHYNYLITEKNLINSVLSDNPIEDIKEIETRKFLAELPDEIFTAYHDAKDLSEQKKYLPAFEKALHAHNSSKDLDNIKRALIFGAMIEGDDKEATDYYDTMFFINKKTFGRFAKEGETIINYLNVDMLIAETIRLSRTKSVSNINKDLEGFLTLTAKIYSIEKKQYDILQKIFAYFGAYEQEIMVLDAMVENHIERTLEQEERLLFLKEHKKSNFSALQVDVDESVETNSEDDVRKLVYEYRTLLWSEKETKDYFDSLSVQNQSAKTPYVINEWTKNISAPNISWDFESVWKKLDNAMQENFGERFRVIGGDSCPTGAINDADKSIIIADISDGGYNWIWFNVVGEQMLKNQVTISIYAIYMSELDGNPNASIIERNKEICSKLLSFKQKQNPKINNYIQTITDVIIKNIEEKINTQSENDIYS